MVTEEQPTVPITGLLIGSGTAFVGGIVGSIWYTQRKQNRRLATEIAEGTVHNTYTTPKYIPPKMTPAEYEIAKKEASLYAFKTLGYGTLLAWGGFGLLAIGVGYCLDVHNFREFSDKLQVIIPQKTSRLRQMLGGTKFELTNEEKVELDAIEME
ncbi:hypothetical protein BDB01DRAFT_759387 [Pilobolus umbonatus]|nr:hypothetical protein BDB01DRAFT_759387 [Pilobolus umbonatus]